MPCIYIGLIASVGTGGDGASIDLIRELVISYIAKPSCIILLTVACESAYPYTWPKFSEFTSGIDTDNISTADFMNQGAHELSRLYDPNGKRTIGNECISPRKNLLKGNR